MRFFSATSLVVLLLASVQARPHRSLKQSLASTPAPAPAPAPGSGGAQNYTLANVAQHSGSSSCWVAINGYVLDLTNWAPIHPGGADRIYSVCGTDGSSQFNQQHGFDMQRNPNGEVATNFNQYIIAPLTSS